MQHELEDLFKSELGLEKAEVCKACGQLKKSAAPHKVVNDTNDGRHTQAGTLATGKNPATPTRTMPGVRRTTPLAPTVKAEAGSYESESTSPEMSKGGDLSSSESASSDDGSSDSMSKGIKVVGSAWCQYVNTGADEEMAKAILEGTLGQGHNSSRPIDNGMHPSRTAHNFPKPY